MAERMVLFGGTFNPIHNGHLIAARAVAEQLGASRITLVPAAAPPHKAVPADDDGASPEQRLEMVRLAIAGEELFEVSDIELRHSRPSYTFDTLTELREAYGPGVELNWLVGADMLADLPSWHRATEVVALARIITAARPPWSGRIAEILVELGSHFPAEVVSELAEGVVATPLIDISSTDIRCRARSGQSIRFLTPAAVVDYVNRHGIYRPAGR